MGKIAFIAVFDDGAITKYDKPQTITKVFKDFKYQCQWLKCNGLLLTAGGWAVRMSGKDRTLEKYYELSNIYADLVDLMK